VDQSTEYLLHILGVALDNLRERMRLEAVRNHLNVHYHLVANYKCNLPGCSGPDPVISTYATLLSELEAIDKEFIGHILPVQHIP
jgi:hypothetical protein